MKLCTYNEWLETGHAVIKGSREVGWTEDHIGLFSDGQVTNNGNT